MDPDRRESLRRDVWLPFQWQLLETPLPAAELGKLFDLPPTLQLCGRLADLEVEYSQVTRQIRDQTTAAALDLINARVTALQEALFAEQPQPAGCAIEISAAGIAFAAAEPVHNASWLGVHFVLPSCYHVCCVARVRRCEALLSPAGVSPAGYRIAAQLEALDGAASRRLSRFVIENNS